jgi:hypothetical protein
MRGACPRSAMSCGLVAAGQDHRGRRFKLSVRAKVLFIWDDKYFHYFLSAMTQKWRMSAPSVCCFGQESNRLFTSLLASSDKPADTSNWQPKTSISPCAPLRAANAGADGSCRLPAVERFN